MIEVDEPNSKEPSVQVLFPRKGKKGKRKGRLAKLREGKNIIKDKEVIKEIKQGQIVFNQTN